MNTPLKPRIARRSLPCAALIIFLLASSASLPAARGALDPAPDGGYPGYNTAEGDGALFNLANGASSNTAVGFSALYSNGGDNNTAVGWQALTSNTTGSDNTAVGSAAGDSIKAGSQNTAIGSSALFGAINASASYNTAIGFQSLYSVSTGYGNVANGWQALYSNRTGIYNTATGAEALYSNDANANNVTDFNTATGGRALYTNLSGTSNTATGYLALYYNKSGSYNTAEGISALSNNTTGSNNVAIGRDAGANLTTGANNIVIGASVLGKAGEANTTRIGNTTQKKAFIGGIYNIAEPVASGIKPVYINSNGQLGTTPPASSARFKETIKPMDKVSDGILSLQPVTFRYKDDPERISQFGLIAEEVAKVNPDLVVRDEGGQIYTVRYDAVNAMLLNEFLKEHHKVEQYGRELVRQKEKAQEQGATIHRLEDLVTAQAKRIESLDATLQKVSVRVELQERIPRLTSTD
ncbi:MAG: hypothetical protein DME42_08495 [Verrucomicrobia bacterium]|nr:MAG: hypothetical protein DME42_08495 [Verrucomicrobiota bacterium]